MTRVSDHFAVRLAEGQQVEQAVVNLNKEEAFEARRSWLIRLFESCSNSEQYDQAAKLLNEAMSSGRLPYAQIGPIAKIMSQTKVRLWAQPKDAKKNESVL
ncbi:MAG: hypothetical protein LC104_06790 [Bacteroidales bacterium]|nr:hypothetical protein [Bacteroidales bacterium]